jgi:hypothetical protein
MPVTGTAGAPAIYDWVFIDIYGETAIGDGFYKIDGNRYIEVENGIIVEIDAC